MNSTPYTWRHIAHMIAKHKKTLIIANILSVLTVLLSVPTPLFMPMIVDELILGKVGYYTAYLSKVFDEVSAYHYIIVGFVLVVGFRGASLGFTLLQLKFYAMVSKSIVYQMRLSALDHLQKITMKAYESLPTGDIASKLVTDLNTIDEFISQSISKLITSVLSIIGVFVILLHIDVFLAFVIIGLNPFVIALSGVLSAKVAKLKAKENASIALFQDAITETMELFTQIRSSNREPHYMGLLSQKAHDIRDYAVAYGYKGEGKRQISFYTFTAGIELFRALIIFSAYEGTLSVGLMIASFAYLWFLITPVQQLIGIQYAYNSADAALQRVNAILQIDIESPYPHHQNPFRDHQPHIALKQVGFGYGDTTILSDATLHIKPYEKVAIIGPSGSGKTTAAQLLVGFYEVDAGDIVFDDISYKDIGLDVVRENVFLVLQSPVIFNDTVRENLTMGGSYSDQQIHNALKIAQLQEVVASMPKGLESVLGKHGIRLSGGQRQRLAIARMVLKNPKIVILDESTSALDTATETKLYEALDVFLQDKTVVTIAHRIHTLRYSQSIYEIDDGKFKPVMVGQN